MYSNIMLLMANLYWEYIQHPEYSSLHLNYLVVPNSAIQLLCQSETFEQVKEKFCARNYVLSAKQVELKDDLQSWFGVKFTQILKKIRLDRTFSYQTGEF